MTDYAIINLKDIEDSAGERAPGVEARFARKHIDSEHLGVTYIRYEAGVRSPMAHSHREQEEAYVVIAGSGRVRLDDEPILRSWREALGKQLLTPPRRGGRELEGAPHASGLGY